MRTRQPQLAGAKPAADLATVAVRQPQVQAHHVVLGVLEALERLGGTRGGVDRIAFAAQPGGQSSGEVELVLDDEQSHGAAG